MPVLETPGPEAPGLIWKSLSVAGFLALVIAYLVNQTGRCLPTSRGYLLANTLGAAVLAGYSARIDEPVFVALEVFWSLSSLVALLRARSATGETA